MIKTIIKDRLYFIENLLTIQQIEKYVEYINKLESNYPNKAQIKKNRRFLCQSIDHELSNEFWNLLKDIIPKTFVDENNRKLTFVGCSERIPVIRYNVDAVNNQRHKDPKWRKDEHFSIIIYLNNVKEDKGNGDTSFYHPLHKSVFRSKAKAGNAVMFRMDMFHRGWAPKTIKYVICPRLLCHPNYEIKTKGEFESIKLHPVPLQ